MARQDAGQSTAARNDEIIPSNSPTGGGGQNSTGEAATANALGL